VLHTTGIEHTACPLQATDWLDGALARRLGHTSRLGSYLDPLGDKALVCCIVGALGVSGQLPTWLVALVLGRDTVQVFGMAAHRMSMFSGRWPGTAAFFDVDGGEPGYELQQQQQQQQQEQLQPLQTMRTQQDLSQQAQARRLSQAGVLPQIRPLLVSKVNTALLLLLVGGCLTHQAVGVPEADALNALEIAVAGTTAVSGCAYAWLYATGRLLPKALPPQSPQP
jgi:cardiolipin synthase (CMP-forming)